MSSYSLSSIKHALENPRLAFWELVWLYKTRLRDDRGIAVMEEDWDNLIVLDACRYDLFETVNPLPGKLRAVRSKGSHTADFLRRNFGEGAFPDTVYVSATPQFVNHGVHTRFHDTAYLWETEWDDEIRTVPPKAVAERTVEAHRNHPHKRIIAHFLQPHYPFIGQHGREIEHGTLTGGGIISEKRDHKSVWDRLEAGEIADRTVWKAYRENLELVFPHVRKLLEELPGKTIVTSDHGNAFGRYGVYGHPRKRYMKDLITVPWLTIDSDDRRTIKRGRVEQSSAADSNIEKQLQALGYTE